jgi:hypothetical protein
MRLLVFVLLLFASPLVYSASCDSVFNKTSNTTLAAGMSVRGESFLSELPQGSRLLVVVGSKRDVLTVGSAINELYQSGTVKVVDRGSLEMRDIRDSNHVVVVDRHKQIFKSEEMTILPPLTADALILKGRQIEVVREDLGHFLKFAKGQRAHAIQDGIARGVIKVKSLADKLLMGVPGVGKVKLPVAEKLKNTTVMPDVWALRKGGNKLLESGELEVFAATGRMMPQLLKEVGTLRESVYRRAGLGTGKSRDLDAFDSTYDHLIVWNKAKNRVEAAVRLGEVSKIVPEKGFEGLSLNSAFELKGKFHHKFRNGLELSRLVLRDSRDSESLLALEFSLGEYLLKNPQVEGVYTVLSFSKNTSGQVMGAELQSITGRSRDDLGLQSTFGHNQVFSSLNQLSNVSLARVQKYFDSSNQLQQIRAVFSGDSLLVGTHKVFDSADVSFASRTYLDAVSGESTMGVVYIKSKDFLANQARRGHIDASKIEEATQRAPVRPHSWMTLRIFGFFIH